MININKKDVLWSYFSKFFNLASGLLILPLMLTMLSEDEVGMNYLMLTIGSLVTLLDFGFAPQFGRNISYLYSGAQELKKEGVVIPKSKFKINYKLLATMICTAKYVYKILGLIVSFILLSFGTLYIYKATDGFLKVNHSLLIWIIFSFSTFLNIYYSYYISLLSGKGMIMESNKAMLYSKLCYVFLSILLLFLGFGLLGVTIAGLISPLIHRYFSYNFFFTKDFNDIINQYKIHRKDIKELFIIIWFNSKKLGLVTLGAFAISKFSLFIAGLFLSLPLIASYGLMMQIVGVISGLSTTLFITYQPKFSFYRIKGNSKSLISLLSFCMFMFYLIFIAGGLTFLFVGPSFLELINSNVTLPSLTIVFIYLVVSLLEGNHSLFATLILTKNEIPFVKPALISGFFIAIGSYICLKYTNMGLLGLILVQGGCQLVYNNWRWPLYICREFNISFIKILELGYSETKSNIYEIFK